MAKAGMITKRSCCWFQTITVTSKVPQKKFTIFMATSRWSNRIELICDPWKERWKYTLLDKTEMLSDQEPCRIACCAVDFLPLSLHSSFYVISLQSIDWTDFKVLASSVNSWNYCCAGSKPWIHGILRFSKVPLKSRKFSWWPAADQIRNHVGF